MLKKLVKYGNSSALVLDKALLEILNITEGSVVKIKTDGISLIITPQNMVAKEIITPTIMPQETLKEAIAESLERQTANDAHARAYNNELNAVLERYSLAMKKLETPEVQQERQAIEQRFNGNRLDPEYSKAMVALSRQYAPELALLDQEVEAVSKKYAMHNAMIEFKRVHEKYQHLMPQVLALNENPEYINETVLLTEKYQVTKNSPEYFAELSRLIARYIPEYAVYQDELKKAGELLENRGKSGF